MNNFVVPLIAASFLFINPSMASESDSKSDAIVFVKHLGAVGIQGKCAANTFLATFHEINKSNPHSHNAEACAVLGQNDIVRLAGMGSMAGPGYGCKTFEEDARDMVISLCRQPVADSVIAKQREELKEHSNVKTGPQAPRDIALVSTLGSNSVFFTAAPSSNTMNLCNIHFHKNAEHKGGQFTSYAGNGNGDGNQSGYKSTLKLTNSELSPANGEICPSAHSYLQSGDTIEAHYVYSSANVKPGHSLAACFSGSTAQSKGVHGKTSPQLRVETQVYVLVNDRNAKDFNALAKYEIVNEPIGTNLYQATGLPTLTESGNPVEYAGSTTGPGYNETPSPYLVTWAVRPKVVKVNIATVGRWCDQTIPRKDANGNVMKDAEGKVLKGNVFEEDHAHGVRNLVKEPSLLSRN
ncbi:MAG: delta-class carbonic anhydrase [Gallionellaceae bacterium]